MGWPSIGLILSVVFLTYIVYSIFLMSQLFIAPTCEEGKFCLTSYLSTKPPLQLHLFSSTVRNPMEREVSIVNTVSKFNYNEVQDIPVNLNIPRKTQQNGTMYLHMLLVLESKKRGRSYSELKREPYMAYAITKITRYAVPGAEMFNLLRQKGTPKEGVKEPKGQAVKPVTHIKSRITLTIMTDDIKLPIDNIPMELINNIRVVQRNVFLPIVNFDFLQTMQHDLIRVTPQNNTINLTISYNPISLGKLRLMLHIEAAMQSLKNLGFSDKDTDELKSILIDTNVYLLAGTFIIGALHMLLDFLAFKNDISFWRRRDNLVGLSKWTGIWCAFNHTVIFFYLLDENASLLILVPTGIGTVIEFWKVKKVLRAEFVRGSGILPRIRFNTSNSNADEVKTREFDTTSMRYLSYLLYPLVIGGAIYSLLYQPHKSWYSWSINSLVKGVYAFGFLFMLPQLFVNYKLKSVAHLPWRSFMYKAFNTFIDDVFAFIITMPTTHRIACFGDDIVFLIYLYQRWLYPVDKTRIDCDALVDGTLSQSISSKKTD